MSSPFGADAPFGAAQRVELPGVVSALAPHQVTYYRPPYREPCQMKTSPTQRVVVLDREQRELLRLLSTGLPDTAIARRMALAPRTLARRIASLYQMLQADNRFQAGAAAERLGLLAVTHAVEQPKPVAV